VELLVKAGADLNRQTAQGSTALLMAATTTTGLSPLHMRVAHPDFPAVVRALVDAGADVNLPGRCWRCVAFVLVENSVLFDQSCYALSDSPVQPSSGSPVFTYLLTEPAPPPALHHPRMTGADGRHALESA
jgi:hypothetical protein